MIQVNNVTKKYGSATVLSGINLHIAKGDVAVICGPSGSGKSTLIKTINGLESINSGNIFVAGHDISLMTHTSLTKKVGMVFQDFALFSNMTVLENLVVPQVHVHKVAKDDAVSKAKLQLAALGMASHANKYPSQLSGGQQQRAAIARALVTDPEYLLFDEPTSALDPEMVSDILNVMEGLARKGMTLIVVTHEMSFARKVANKVIFMDAGKIVEESKSADFFESPKSQRARDFLSKVIR